MGAVVGRFRKKQSSKDVLEQLTKDIKLAETQRLRAEYLHGKTVGYLIIFALIFYLLAAVFYFYYFPKDLPERLVFVMPLVVFPLVVHLVRKLLHYIFAHRKSHSELKLSELHAQRTRVLDKVKENETYKVAQELLEKYDPDYRKSQQHDRRQTSRQREGTELRQRRVDSPRVGQRPPLPPQPVATSPPQRVAYPRPLTEQPQSPQPPPLSHSTPEMRQQMGPSPPDNVQPQGRTMRSANQGEAAPLPPPQVYHLMPGYVARPAPGPPVQCPILPRERSSVDKVVEYLVGDGPNNRYALICSECYSHNGMALPDEFEYLSFRCAYCYALNPARKQKPHVSMVTHRETRPHPPSAAASPAPVPEDEDETRGNGDATLVADAVERREDGGDGREETQRDDGNGREGTQQSEEEREHGMENVLEDRDERDVDNADQ